MHLCHPRDNRPWESLVGFTGGTVVKNLPLMQELPETQFRSLGWENTLEEDMATHSSIVAWRIPWAEEPGRLPSMGSQRVGHDLATQEQQQQQIRQRRMGTRWFLMCFYFCLFGFFGGNGERTQELLFSSFKPYLPRSSPGWSRVFEGEMARRPIQMLIRDNKE